MYKRKVRSWLGLPRSFSSIILFGNNNDSGALPHQQSQRAQSLSLSLSTLLSTKTITYNYQGAKLLLYELENNPPPPPATESPDWNSQGLAAIKMALGKPLKFPENLVETSLITHIVLLSETSKQVIFLEPTVPWEERMEVTNERKKEKNTELVATCHRRGWHVRCLPIEVRVRGIAGKSLWKAFSLLLGITRPATKEASYFLLLGHMAGTDLCEKK